jgi:hypothetical protein
MGLDAVWPSESLVAPYGNLDVISPEPCHDLWKSGYSAHCTSASYFERKGQGTGTPGRSTVKPAWDAASHKRKPPEMNLRWAGFC